MQVPDATRIRRLKIAAAEMGPSEFVGTHLFGKEAHVLGWGKPEHDAFCDAMGARLGVPSENIGLIGSAKLGFSLNPSRLLRPFQRQSDLDLVVVSSEVFDRAVLELRSAKRALELAGEDERKRLKRSRDNVFNGFIRPDQLPLSATLQREWFPLLAGPYDSEPARSHEVRAWLFKSWEHAAICYVDHHISIQDHVKRLVRLSEATDGGSR